MEIVNRMSHTNFDANNFSRNAGFAMFGAITSAVSAARANAKAHADAMATDEALRSWIDLASGLEADVDYLHGVNGELAAALRQRDDVILFLQAELATARQRIADAGIGDE